MNTMLIAFTSLAALIIVLSPLSRLGCEDIKLGEVMLNSYMVLLMQSAQ